MEFHVTIRSKIAVYMGIDPYICGNSDFVIHFDMDEEWAAHETKTARFVKEDGTYQDQVFTGNECPVPVISDTYGIRVGVYAGNLHTTTPAYIPAKKSILCASGMPSAPSDDVYAQIMQKIDDGLLKGEKGDKGEPGEPGKDGEPGEKGEPGEPGKDAEPYTLPTASADTLGGVKVGSGLRMDGDVLEAEVQKEDVDKLSYEIANKKGLTSAQITALDNMFKICAYASSADSAYAAFCDAFGIAKRVYVSLPNYSDWKVWGSDISVISNGFSVASSALNYNSGVAVGILQGGTYGTFKDKTLKISCDIEGDITTSGSGIVFSLNTYSDTPVESFNDYCTAIAYFKDMAEAGHVEVTVKPSETWWQPADQNDTDYLAIKFYCHMVGNVTITNFRVEAV